MKENERQELLERISDKRKAEYETMLQDQRAVAHLIIERKEKERESERERAVTRKREIKRREKEKQRQRGKERKERERERKRESEIGGKSERD